MSAGQAGRPEAGSGSATRAAAVGYHPPSRRIAVVNVSYRLGRVALAPAAVED